MRLDTTLWHGMNPTDRQQALMRLAILPTEAAEASEAERRDDEQ